MCSAGCDVDMWRPGNEAHNSAFFFWNCLLHLWNRTNSWWCINIIYTVLYNPAGSSSSMSRSRVSVSESFRVVQPLSCICLSAVLQNVFTWLDFFTGLYSVFLVALALPPAFDCDLLRGKKKNAISIILMAHSYTHAKSKPIHCNAIWIDTILA